MTRPRRPTAGRPPLSETKERVRLHVYLDPETRDAIDEARGSIPASEWARDACLQRLVRERRKEQGQ